MKLIGKLEHEGKVYTNQDVKGVVPLNQLGVEDNFYGGNVTQFGLTETPGVYLCLNKSNDAIDIVLVEDEPVEIKALTVIDDTPKVVKPSKAKNKAK